MGSKTVTAKQLEVQRLCQRGPEPPVLSVGAKLPLLLLAEAHPEQSGVLGNRVRLSKLGEPEWSDEGGVATSHFNLPRQRTGSDVKEGLTDDAEDEWVARGESRRNLVRAQVRLGLVTVSKRASVSSREQRTNSIWSMKTLP